MSQIGALFEGLFGDAGQSFVDEQGGADKVFGTKPDIAPFVPVDLADETKTAIAGNVANFDAVTEYLDKVIPGFSDILKSGLSNTQQLERGELPDDVKSAVMRSSAFRSLGGGFGSTSPMGKGLTARDLGLTSLNLIQMGQNSAQTWAQLAEQAYSPFTVTTSQQAAVTAANNAGKQATDQFANNVAAAPDPGALGIFNVDAALGQQMLSFGLGAAGSFMGGGSSGGSAQAPAGGTNWQLVGGGGSAPAFQYNPSTGQFQQVPAAQPANAWGYCDAKLKQIIKFVRRTAMGFKVYWFRYKGCPNVFEGAVAQQVARVNPNAVYDDDGYLMVNYGMTDIIPRLVKEEPCLTV